MDLCIHVLTLYPVHNQDVADRIEVDRFARLDIDMEIIF